MTWLIRLVKTHYGGALKLILDSLPNKKTINARRILVVGDVMLDRYWHGNVYRISPEAPVPIVNVSGVEHRLGGAGNVAVNIRSLGARATLLTVVGVDEPAKIIKGLLELHCIDAELGVDPRMSTIVKLRVVAQAQQMIRIDFETDPDYEVLSEMVNCFRSCLATHDAVIFSDYGKGGLAHIPEMIEIARNCGTPVLIDPKGSDWIRYSFATLITPNRSELAQVIGQWKSEGELHEKAQAVRVRFGLNALLLTRSEDGMTLFESGRVSSVKAKAHEVIDVTGAGDTVIATMGVMIASGLKFELAMEFANRAAGIVVSKFGAAHVSYEELTAPPQFHPS